jgi:hypothetical protein
VNDTIVTVVNRSSKDVTATADGQHYTFPAHGEKMLPQWKAIICRRQSAIFGTEDYYRPGAKAFLLAIKELGHDLTPCEQQEGLDSFEPDSLPLEARGRTLIGRKTRPSPAEPIRDAAFGSNS